MAHESILIVDDNAANLKLARVLLTNAGYDVRCAENGEQALETLQSSKPALILMDIQMPGMDGLELTRRLRANPETAHTLIVALTAYATKADEEKAREAGCDGYITKPINTREFVQHIREYLGGQSAPGGQTGKPSGDPNDLLRELRNSFIADGEESSARIADTDPMRFDVAALCRIVHHWAGIGGTLGFPEVTAHAHELETLLHEQPVAWQHRAAAGFTAMRRLFKDALSAESQVTGASGLFAELVGKQIAILGFDAQEAERVRGAFDQVGAVTRDLGALAGGLGSDALLPHDLIVLNACTQAGVGCWDSVQAQPVFEKPLLIVSSRSALLDSRLAFAERAVDFVLTPWDAEELLFRAQRAIHDRHAPRAAAPPPRMQKRSVLIADDDPVIHSLLIPMLNKLGVDCYSAHDGREALDVIRNLGPDAVILDIGMPRVSGLSVLTEIRKTQQNHTLPILMLTARQQRSDVNMALGFGASDYITKPFDPEDVVVRITRLLSGYQGAGPQA